MVDKKIVDDYYSQINSSKDEKSENKAKPKIVAKRKIIVKKPQIDSNKKTTNLKGEKKWGIVKKDTKQKKWFVQKIEVNKKTNKVSVVKRDEVIKRDEKKEKANAPKKITVIKRWDPDFVEKTNNSRNNYKNNNSNQEQIKDWIKFKLRSNNSDDKNKKFSNNSSRNNNTKINQNYDEQKKSKLGFKNKKTRWRFDFNEEKELVFTRSNKINTKKEKKVEDIKQNLVERKWQTVIVPEILSLKELSEKIWITLPLLMAEFMKNGMMVTINSKIDFDSASIVSEAFEVKLEKDISWWASIEDLISWNISDLLKEDDSSKLSLRTPVVSIMWHVDHGKTSLLDYIRSAKIASKEAGWITQSIWAYQVESDNGKITFLDTPWHEAFTIMRARWAKSTDIAILVVAADEWVKPQTIESINHAKEAWIPIIVAINKMDKTWANPDFVKWQLAEKWLTSEDWGWDTPMVPVSAHTGFWIDELLEIILLVAEMKELKANPNRSAIATVIESHLDNQLWPVASVLINTGTIRSWDNIVCQDTYWKIKVLKNYLNHSVKSALPWEPVLIVWLDKVVSGWDILQVVSSVEIAKQKALEYRVILERKKTAWNSWLSLLMSKIKAWNLKQLKIILKADTNWSLEAIKWAIIKLSTPETTVSIIHAWVWSITEWDALIWKWSEAVLVWYNVLVLPTAKSSLESSWVEYINSKIIYHITERLEKIVTWMLDPKEVDIELGKAKVWWIFFTSKEFLILGLKLAPKWKIENKALVRITRKKKFLWNWVIESLKSWTIEVKELEGPIECWIKLKTNVSVEMWDEFEIHKVEIEK